MILTSDSKLWFVVPSIRRIFHEAFGSIIQVFSLFGCIHQQEISHQFSNMIEHSSQNQGIWIICAGQDVGKTKIKWWNHKLGKEKIEVLTRRKKQGLGFEAYIDQTRASIFVFGPWFPSMKVRHWTTVELWCFNYWEARHKLWLVPDSSSNVDDNQKKYKNEHLQISNPLLE